MMAGRLATQSTTLPAGWAPCRSTAARCGRGVRVLLRRGLRGARAAFPRAPAAGALRPVSPPLTSASASRLHRCPPRGLGVGCTSTARSATRAWYCASGVERAPCLAAAAPRAGGATTPSARRGGTSARVVEGHVKLAPSWQASVMAARSSTGTRRTTHGAARRQDRAGRRAVCVASPRAAVKSSCSQCSAHERPEQSWARQTRPERRDDGAHRPA